jgi:ABC-type transporter Mla subunit MlaD
VDPLAQDLRLARRIGTLTLVVTIAAIAGFVFLFDRSTLGSPTRIRVMFRNTAGLREHAKLVVAGQPIGQIEAIVPVLHGAEGPLAGEVGVAAIVAIDEGSAWKVPARAEIFVASRGPLSDKYLEVAPPLGEPGPPVHDGLELRGIDPPSLDNIFQHTWTNLTTFREFVEAVGPELDALRTQLDATREQLDRIANDAGTGDGGGALATEIRALARAARQTYQTPLGGDAGLARFRATVEGARQVSAQLRAAIDVLGPQGATIVRDLERMRGHLAAADPTGRAEHTIAGVQRALDKIDPLLAKLAELGARIAAGEGSLGRLMLDPEFPEDARNLGKIIKRQPWKVIMHGRGQ